MAGENANNSGINISYSSPSGGLSKDISPSEPYKRDVSYALNASVEGIGDTSFFYQNEHGNSIVVSFPEGYICIGRHYIAENNLVVFFLTNPNTQDSEIGKIDLNSVESVPSYETIVNSKCLNFNKLYPIHKVVHRQTGCSVEIYWTDGYNPRRYMDINNPPFNEPEDVTEGGLSREKQFDCNRIKVQPDFKIPVIKIRDVTSGGNLKAGAYYFAVQYADAYGKAYTSLYSFTHPIYINNPKEVGGSFDFYVNKSIVIDIENIDTSGVYDYLNVIVLKHTSAGFEARIADTIRISLRGNDEDKISFTYSGQDKSEEVINLQEILESFNFYEVADDLTESQGVLIWSGLKTQDKYNFQKIANSIKLYWETYRLPPGKSFSDEIISHKYRGYLRDEVYAFEIQFIMSDGRLTDGFHIPGRPHYPNEKLLVSENDPDNFSQSPSEYWKIFNTANLIGTYEQALNGGEDYFGPYQYGEFAYHESTMKYPDEPEVWGELAGKPIRHHRFPDNSICPFIEGGGIEYDENLGENFFKTSPPALFPIGVKVDVEQIKSLINSSEDIPKEVKDKIVGFRILRGNRAYSKTIVAKGLVRNVGKYDREYSSYYFPNYPFNDLNEDPFLLSDSNFFIRQCSSYTVTCVNSTTVYYRECSTNKLSSYETFSGEVRKICSTIVPYSTIPTDISVVTQSKDIYKLEVVRSRNLSQSSVVFGYLRPDNNSDFISVKERDSAIVEVFPGTVPQIIEIIGRHPRRKIHISKIGESFSVEECVPPNLKAFESDESKQRFVFNSPETSFSSPVLPSVFKIEGVLGGGGFGHFVQVKDHPRSKLLTYEAYKDAIDAAVQFSAGNNSILFSAIDSYIKFFENSVNGENLAYSYNTTMFYNNFYKPNYSEFQNSIDIKAYLSPYIVDVGDIYKINNLHRESSVYIKTKKSFKFPHEVESLSNSGLPLIKEKSRYIASQQSCTSEDDDFRINSVVYYASLKRDIPDVWGAIYSYQIVDTGFVHMFKWKEKENPVTVFGGDTFISKMSFKSKVPFFKTNYVGAENNIKNVDYDLQANLAYPRFWYSSRPTTYSYKTGSLPEFKNFINIDSNFLDCPNSQNPAPDSSTSPPTVNPDRILYKGKFYLFAYGVISFYCESSINTENRQALNTREGDYYPRMGEGIPDEWFQENNVPIIFDNFYNYNSSFSKQLTEVRVGHLPLGWKAEDCFRKFPFRSIYSDPQRFEPDNATNSWRIYRPLSFYDFPQNLGNLVSLDGLERGVLVRFENRSLLYGYLLTFDTSNADSVYIGNPKLFEGSPPINLGISETGFAGSQHKFILFTPFGAVYVDAKRGSVLLLTGDKVEDLVFSDGRMREFFEENLPFKITKYFPEIDGRLADNHFYSVGIHGTYDQRLKRIIITKIDYEPKNDVYYDENNGMFYTLRGSNKVYVFPEDSRYFCNKSFTVSYSFLTRRWTSFHSYTPNFYISTSSYFYSGVNNRNCILDFLVLEENGQATFPTTTTTTVNPLDCAIAGTAEEIDCDFSFNTELINCNFDFTCILQ